jgi:hypothetical protein
MKNIINKLQIISQTIKIESDRDKNKNKQEKLKFILKITNLIQNFIKLNKNHKITNQKEK